MADVAYDIERLVREVLAELGLAPKPSEATRPAPAETAAPVATPSPRPAETPGELVVTARVVTLAELGERLTPVRRLVVSPQAIVTPSVRDELRRRKIELVVGQPAGSPAPQGAPSGLLVFVHGKSFDAAPLVKALAADVVSVELKQSDCVIAATDQLAQALAGPARLGVLLTRHTAAGLCLANRHPGVRAIVGSDRDGTLADAASVGANLLVVDPKRNGTFKTRQLIGLFYRQGPQQCPKVFEKQLK
jgi:hypothetical protein